MTLPDNINVRIIRVGRPMVKNVKTVYPHEEDRHDVDMKYDRDRDRDRDGYGGYGYADRDRRE